MTRGEAAHAGSRDVSGIRNNFPRLLHRICRAWLFREYQADRGLHRYLMMTLFTQAQA